MSAITSQGTHHYIDFARCHMHSREDLLAMAKWASCRGGMWAWAPWTHCLSHLLLLILNDVESSSEKHRYCGCSHTCWMWSVTRGNPAELGSVYTMAQMSLLRPSLAGFSAVQQPTSAELLCSPPPPSCCLSHSQQQHRDARNPVRIFSALTCMSCSSSSLLAVREEYNIVEEEVWLCAMVSI